MSQGLVFYEITRDSEVAGGTSARFSFDGNRTTTSKLREDVLQRQGVDAARMVVEVRKHPPPTAVPKPAGATPEPVLGDDAVLLNYTKYEVRIAKRSKEFEVQKQKEALSAIESALFSSADGAEPRRPFTVAGQPKSKNLRPSAKKPSVSQLAVMALLDLPLDMAPVAVAARTAATPQKCVLCDERLDGQNVPSERCDQCGPAACGGCFEHCWAETGPKCPICGCVQVDRTRDGKIHRTE